MKPIQTVFGVLSIATLAGCDTPPITEWNATFSDGENINEVDTVTYAAVNYEEPEMFFGIEPNKLQASWSGSVSVSESDNPDKPAQKTFNFNIQSDNALTEIKVNNNVIGNWTSGDHIVAHTFPEGEHSVVITYENHSPAAMFNATLNRPQAIRDTESVDSSLLNYRTQPEAFLPADVYYVKATKSSNIDNSATVSLAGLNIERQAHLYLSSDNAINWRISEKPNDLKFDIYINGIRPESSVIGEGFSVSTKILDDLIHSNDSEMIDAYFQPLYAHGTTRQIIVDTVNTLILHDPLSAIPDDAAAKPFYGQWDSIDPSTNEIERIHVFVQNGSLVMSQGVEIDASGRVVDGGNLRNAAFTENFFSDIAIDFPATTSSTNAQISETQTGSTFTIGNTVFKKSEPDALLCGGTQPFYGVRNLLVHSPETENGAVLDDCAQRAFEILKRQSRSGANLWIHRFPLYLVYLADYELSIGDNDQYEKHLDIARALINILSHDPDLENTAHPDFALLNNISIALSDADLVTGSSISTTRGRYARQVMSIGSVMEEEITATESSVLLPIIQALYEDAAYLKNADAITEVKSTASKIENFIVRADERSALYITNASSAIGENFVAALSKGDSALADLNNLIADFDFLQQVPGQHYADQFFIMHANALQEYLDAHPGFSFFGMNIHHAVEQNQDWTSYLGYNKLQSILNFRGIPAELNDELHLSKIRVCWNQLYNKYPNRNNIPETELLDRARYIDDQYGHLFVPAIRPIPAQGADYMPDCVAP